MFGSPPLPPEESRIHLCLFDLSAHWSLWLHLYLVRKFSLTVSCPPIFYIKTTWPSIYGQSPALLCLNKEHFCLIETVPRLNILVTFLRVLRRGDCTSAFMWEPTDFSTRFFYYHRLVCKTGPFWSSLWLSHQMFCPFGSSAAKGQFYLVTVTTSENLVTT